MSSKCSCPLRGCPLRGCPLSGIFPLKGNDLSFCSFPWLHYIIHSFLLSKVVSDPGTREYLPNFLSFNTHYSLCFFLSRSNKCTSKVLLFNILFSSINIIHYIYCIYCVYTDYWTPIKCMKRNPIFRTNRYLTKLKTSSFLRPNSPPPPIYPLSFQLPWWNKPKCVGY